MPAYNLLNYGTQPLSLGRAAVFRAPYWDGTTDLDLTHLGITMEEIAPPTDEQISALTLPEHTGPAPLEAFAEGSAPTVDFTMLVGSQATLDILNPTGSRNAGYRYRRSVAEHTLVLFPEQLLVEDNAEAAIAYTTVGGWTVGGDAATAAQLALIDLSIWFWRGYFMRTLPVFRHTEGGRVEAPVSFNVMQDLTKPDGSQLYTVGDPVESAIDISPVGG